MNTKLLGSSLIISGTALGAGMLAIPMVLAQFGLWYGTLLMIFICFGIEMVMSFPWTAEPIGQQPDMGV